MFGKWGITPAISTSNLRAKDALSAVDQKVDGRKGGSVRGKKVGNRLSTHVEAVIVDDTLLKESLGEG
jgi:hypothetical protein